MFKCTLVTATVNFSTVTVSFGLETDKRHNACRLPREFVARNSQWRTAWTDTSHQSFIPAQPDLQELVD